MKLFSFRNTLIIASMLFVFSMVGAKLDTDFSLRWYIFFSWIVSLLMFLYAFKIHNSIELDNKSEKNLTVKQIWQEDKFKIILILFIAIATRFIFINIYPFQTIGDELRDGGWDAMRIANGEIKNIFYYGRYEAHGLIIPTTVVPFYWIFGNSDLAFKVPAALLSIIDIVLVYFLSRKFINKKVAIFASLILISLPLHLYYARTQVVVVYSSLFTTIILYRFFKSLKVPILSHFAILGLLLGFTFNLHASVKTFSFLVILLSISFIIYKLVTSKDKKYLTYLLTFVITIFLGFGPRLLFTSTDIFLHKKRLPSVESEYSSFYAEEQKKDNLIEKSWNNYPKSLLVYFYEPTSGSAYQDKRPILHFIIGIFFVIGAIAIVIKNKRKKLKFLLVLSILIPITNSAVTDIVNADHRLGPYLPIAAIIAGFGFYIILNLLKRNKLHNFTRLLIITLFMTLCVFETYSFFFNEKASYSMFRFDKSYAYQDFMLTKATKIIKEDRNLLASKNICISSNDINKDYLEYLHVKEQFMFFSPDKVVVNYSLERQPNNIFYISKDCPIYGVGSKTWIKYEYCRNYQKFICPPDKSNYIIYVEKS